MYKIIVVGPTYNYLRNMCGLLEFQSFVYKWGASMETTNGALISLINLCFWTLARMQCGFAIVAAIQCHFHKQVRLHV